MAVGEILLDEADYLFVSDKKKTAELVIAYIYKKLLNEAQARNEEVESFSSTLSFACLNKTNGKILTFVVGDSLIYSVSDTTFEIAGSPVLPEEGGTFTTTTQGVEDFVDVNIFSSEDYLRFVLCTDGAWRTFYKNGVLCDEVFDLMKSKDIKHIEKYFDLQENFDDCSCIIIDV